MSQTALQTSHKPIEVDMLRNNVNELQKQLQDAYTRIGELVEERDSLRCTMIDKIKR